MGGLQVEAIDFPFRAITPGQVKKIYCLLFSVLYVVCSVL